MNLIEYQITIDALRDSLINARALARRSLDYVDSRVDGATLENIREIKKMVGEIKTMVEEGEQ